MTNHSTPWRVEYARRYPWYHKFALPHIVDANGLVVLTPPQNVDHPGKHDVKASALCALIVTAVNKYLEGK